MKKVLFLLLLVALQSCKPSIKQETLLLAPNEDTFIHSIKSDVNFSKSEFIQVSNFISNEKKIITRGLFNFDFSIIPTEATIDSSFLYIDSPYDESKKSSGKNELLVQQVVEKWSDSTVNWSNQPKSIENLQIILPKSTNVFQDHQKIDVSQMVNSMKTNQEYFGFLLKMKEEDDNYKVQWIASKEIKDKALRPALKVFYTVKN